MSRRRSAAIAVAFLLVVAGCGGTGSESATPTADAPAVDSTTSSAGVSTDTISDAEFPDGFSRSDIDISTARRLSVRYLRTEPVSGVALERFRPGAYADYQYEASATRTRFRLDVHNGYADVTQRDVYVESGVRHSRNGRNGQVSFEATNGSVDETRFRAANSMWAVVSRIITIGEFRAVQVAEHTGERRIRYTITDVVVRNATDVRGYLIVNTDGVIREAQLLYSQGGEPKRFQYSVTSRSGSDVTPPAWLPAARTDGPDTGTNKYVGEPVGWIGCSFGTCTRTSSEVVSGRRDRRAGDECGVLHRGRAPRDVAYTVNRSVSSGTAKRPIRTPASSHP